MYTPPEDPADEPAHITRHLAAPIAAAWRGIDKGRAAADEYFSDERHQHDPHLWAHLVRYEAALSLQQEPGPREWDLRLAHHSGIELVQDGFRVKVCKAAAGGPQSPGRNRARRAFFQQLALSLFGGASSANLILYWMVSSGELKLGLCKPEGLWRFKGQPKLEWRQPVRFDPLAGLTFAASAEEDGLEVLRFDEGDLRGEGAEG